VTPIKV